MSQIQLIQGDITTAQVDAIVNAANTRMLGGGGVDGAIHRAAGPGLLQECKQVEAINGVRCATGEARLTGAGNLPAKYVIHTVGPIYSREKEPARLLRAAYLNSLKLASEYQCRTIAFPAISCGVYGYPYSKAAQIAIETCSQYGDENLRVYFYLFNAQMMQEWQSVLHSLEG